MLTQRNRELFSRNKEFCRKNREFYGPVLKSSRDEIFGNLSAETKTSAIRLSFLFLVQSSDFTNHRDQSLGVGFDKFREFRLSHVGGGAAGLLENSGYLRVRHHLTHGVAQPCDDRRGRALRREQACPDVIFDVLVAELLSLIHIS